MLNRICSIADCKNQEFSVWLYKGHQFCQSHYDEKYFSELLSCYKSWDKKYDAPERLRYLIGRYYDEHEKALIGESSLTKEIIHQRSNNWLKTNEGVIFTAIRYPVAYYKLGIPFCYEVHQTWTFDIKSLKFKFLSEEKMK